MKYMTKAEPWRRIWQKFAACLFPLIVHAFCSTQVLARIVIERTIRRSWALCSSAKMIDHYRNNQILSRHLNEKIKNNMLLDESLPNDSHVVKTIKHWSNDIRILEEKAWMAFSPIDVE